MVCVLAAVFLVASFLMCVFLPKGEYSDSERRKLAAPPELSADTIFNGRFMSESETYVQDHFPFRDQFRTLKALSAACLFQRKEIITVSMCLKAQQRRWSILWMKRR